MIGRSGRGPTVLADAGLDTDPEVHRVLTGKVFPQQTDVTAVGGWRSPAVTRI